MSNEKIAMVGTPCQILAATKINKYSDITGGSPIDVKIGLFCMENFSYTYLEKFLNENNIQMHDVKDFRIEKGLFIAFLNNGEEFSIPVEETKIFTRKNCEICTDYTSNAADISVGSVGTDKNYSTVIIRTEKGKEIIENAEKEGYIEVKPILYKGIQLLSKISNKKITNNLENINSRESIARQVLSKREVNEEEVKIQSESCQFKNLEADVISVGGCVLCGACEFVCPENIIQINQRKPQVYGECKEGCNACYYACPRTYVSDEIFPNDIDEKPLGDYIDIKAIKTNHVKGQDGGVVSGLLIYLLEHDIVDEVFLVGEYEGIPWKPRSFVTNKVEDVFASAGTKYSTVPIGFKALTDNK